MPQSLAVPTLYDGTQGRSWSNSIVPAEVPSPFAPPQGCCTPLGCSRQGPSAHHRSEGYRSAIKRRPLLDWGLQLPHRMAVANLRVWERMPCDSSSRGPHHDGVPPHPQATPWQVASSGSQIPERAAGGGALEGETEVRRSVSRRSTAVVGPGTSMHGRSSGPNCGTMASRAVRPAIWQTAH
jgi:hypothetical protein